MQEIQETPTEVFNHIEIFLDDFLDSGFAKKYKIKQDKSWKLNDNFYNNTFSNISINNLIFEATTLDNKISSFGVLFLGSATVSQSQLAFLCDLFVELDPKLKCSQKIKDIVKKSSSIQISHINNAPVQKIGSLNFRAGNIAGDIFISINM